MVINAVLLNTVKCQPMSQVYQSPCMADKVRGIMSSLHLGWHRLCLTDPSVSVQSVVPLLFQTCAKGILKKLPKRS